MNDVPTRSRSRTPLFAILALMVAAAVMQWFAFRPGIMVWDAIRQYRQALSGQYDDWHPPAMNWLWRQLLAFGSGPAPMLTLQAALYWSGLMLLMAAAWRRGGGLAAALIGLATLLPIPLFLVGTVLKDSLMAGALLLAGGLIAIRRPGNERRWNRWLWLPAAALLIAAATLRFNAVPACLPLLVAALPASWKRTRPRFAAVTLLAAIPLFAALPLANRLLHAQKSGVELSLVIYDLGGITHFSGQDAFPPVPVADPTKVAADCYTPISWDRYAWWGAEPCAIGFDNVRTAFAATATSPYRWEATAVIAHPIAYARHRLDHSNNNLHFWVHDQDLPGLSIQSDPNDWGFQVPPNRLRSMLAAIAGWSIDTPIGWPVVWLAIGIGLLVLQPGFDERSLAAPIAWSAVLYALSYVPLSVASEIRYHFWTMTAVAVAAALYIADLRAGRAPPSRRRLTIALLPLAIVWPVCIAARLIG